MEQQLITEDPQVSERIEKRIAQRRSDRQKRMVERHREATGEATYGWRQLPPEFGERETYF